MARLELSVDVVARGVEEAARKVSSTLSSAMREPMRQMEEFTEGVRAGFFGKFATAFEEFQQAQTTVRRRGLAGALGEATGTIGLLGIVAGGVGNIVNMLQGLSPVFRRMSNMIGRLVSLIGRPFADLLSVALYPLIVLLRPIALFFRTLIRPYIQKALEAMRKGELAFSVGEYGIATQYFTIGAMWIVKGLTDAIITALTEVIAGVVEVIPGLGEPVAEAIRGFSNYIIQSTNEFILGLETEVDLSFMEALAEKFNEAVSDFDIDAAEDILNTISSFTGILKSEQETIKSLNISETAKENFSGVLSEMASALSEFEANARIEINEIKRMFSIFVPGEVTNPFVVVVESAGQMAAGLSLVADEMLKKASSLVSKISSLKREAERLVEDIKDIKELLEEREEAMSQLWDWFYPTVPLSVSGPAGFTAGIVGEYLENPEDFMNDVKDIFSNIAESVTSGISWFGETAQNLLSSITNPFQPQATIVVNVDGETKVKETLNWESRSYYV